jgi:hypothetical protein
MLYVNTNLQNSPYASYIPGHRYQLSFPWGHSRTVRSTESYDVPPHNGHTFSPSHLACTYIIFILLIPIITGYLWSGVQNIKICKSVGIEIWPQRFTKTQTNTVKYSWFETFALFWMLYAFFFVIHRHLKFIQGEQKVSVHLMITIQKVTGNVQSVSSLQTYIDRLGSRPPWPGGH